MKDRIKINMFVGEEEKHYQTLEISSDDNEHWTWEVVEGSHVGHSGTTTIKTDKIDDVVEVLIGRTMPGVK